MAAAERRAPSRALGREAEYARAVGERLRAVRVSRGWSLQDVSEASGGRFKSSVVGSYERASRFVSVPRLHTLAEFYGVQLARLLPPEDETTRDEVEEAAARPEVTVDLRALERTSGQEFVPLRRYIESIRVQRGGIGSPTLSVRAGDVSALAAASRLDPQVFVRRLREEGLVTPH